MIKRGDGVIKNDGSGFSNGSKICTVESIDGHKVWLSETGRWIQLNQVTEASVRIFREVTKRELVDGVYGRISVGEHEPGKSIYIGLVSNDGDEDLRRVTWTRDELRDVIHILNQVAEFLDGK